MRDHTEVVKEIRAQNWKVGGALIVDVPDAETEVFNLMQEAGAVIHERCIVAAEEAARRGVGVQYVIDAIRNIRTEV